MKKKFSILSALLFVVAGVNSINAQTSGISVSQFETVRAPLGSQHTSLWMIDVSQNVQKRFQRQFPGADGESWGKTDNGYFVRFTLAGIQNCAFLDKKGNLSGQIRYYYENNLPAEVRARVKSNYYDYRIMSVQEVTVETATSFLVAIAANHEWKIIRVSEDDMDVYREYEDGSTSIK
jgi:hypothetical protein